MTIDFSAVARYWREGARKDFEVANDLAKLGHYAHALFFCHLALEKFLKALYVKNTKEHAPYVHDLIVLVRKGGLSVSDAYVDVFETITTFNIQGRYAGQKSEFYKKFNRKNIAVKYLAATKDIMLWLEKEFQKK